jgi:hypothetical protein
MIQQAQPKAKRSLENEEGHEEETTPSINWNEIACYLGSVILTYSIYYIFCHIRNQNVHCKLLAQMPMRLACRMHDDRNPIFDHWEGRMPLLVCMVKTKQLDPVASMCVF